MKLTDWPSDARGLRAEPGCDRTGNCAADCGAEGGMMMLTDELRRDIRAFVKSVYTLNLGRSDKLDEMAARVLAWLDEQEGQVDAPCYDGVKVEAVNEDDELCWDDCTKLAGSL